MFIHQRKVKLKILNYAMVFNSFFLFFLYPMKHAPGFFISIFLDSSKHLDHSFERPKYLDHSFERLKHSDHSFERPRHLDRSFERLKNLDHSFERPKYLDHSFERLVRNSRAQSPFHRVLTTSHREPYSSIKDTYSSRSRDNLAMKDTYSNRSRDNLSFKDTYSHRSRENLRFPKLSYRSKSYHGDLSRITPSTFTSHFDDVRKSEMYRSERSLSRSVSNLNAGSNLRSSSFSFPSSYVNSYSRHHSHHNHHVPIPPRTPVVQINNRSRFRARNAYKAYRSRSVNRLDESDYAMSRTVRSSTPGTYRGDSMISYLSSHDSLLTSNRISKSMSDIRSIQTRINNELLHQNYPLLRDSRSSIRNIDHHFDSELASHILNPDIYVRWLKNKWDMDESMRRQRSVVSTRSHTDDTAYSVKNRLRGSSYPTRMRFSYDSTRHPKRPIFSNTIRGKSYSDNESVLAFI